MHERLMKTFPEENWESWETIEKSLCFAYYIAAMEEYNVHGRLAENKSILAMAELHMDQRAVTVLKNRISALEKAIK